MIFHLGGQKFQSLSSPYEAVVVSLSSGESSLDVRHIPTPITAGKKTVCQTEFERFLV
jgi:hypothetical protein